MLKAESIESKIDMIGYIDFKVYNVSNEAHVL